MRKVDTSAYSAHKPKLRVKPEKVNLGNLPPIQKTRTEKPAMEDVEPDIVEKVRSIEDGQTRYDEMILKTVSKEVQSFGQTASLYRLSDREKSRLTQLTFQLKSEGHKVSETDIIRIALNYVLEDDETSVTGGIVRRAIRYLKR